MLDKHFVELLLRQANILQSVLDIKLLSMGGNNQTYQIGIEKKSFIAKHYFRHQDDPRDRLVSEYLFLQHCEQYAPCWCPAPIAIDFEKGLAIYEFIEGDRLEARDINRGAVQQAANFFVTINQAKSREAAKNLPIASEACFSIKEHIELVKSRIDKLNSIDVINNETSLVKILVTELTYEIDNFLSKIKNISNELKLDIDIPLTSQNRCISPSDFGFHNAILKYDGSIKFIDFEYAGWDDPAKMVGDFFAQLAVPVPENYFEAFLTEVMKPFSDPQALMLRARLLRVVYKIKWCCIALNIFLPVNLMRRKHSNPNLNEHELKQIQISKAEAILAEIRKTKHVIC